MSAEMALEFLPEEQGQGASVRSTTRGGRDRGSSGGCYEVTLSRFWLKHGRRKSSAIAA